MPRVNDSGMVDDHRGPSDVGYRGVGDEHGLGRHDDGSSPLGRPLGLGAPAACDGEQHGGKTQTSVSHLEDLHSWLASASGATYILARAKKIRGSAAGFYHTWAASARRILAAGEASCDERAACAPLTTEVQAGRLSPHQWGKSKTEESSFRASIRANVAGRAKARSTPSR